MLSEAVAAPACGIHRHLTTCVYENVQGALKGRREGGSYNR